MLLAREVYGWLRHLLNTDPLTLANQVVVEEVPSTFAPQGDTTDGSRTLAIHKISDGLTPRIEVRFTGIRPQVYWYSKDEPHGSLIGLSNQFATVPGDWKSWDCSDFCSWLLLSAKVRLCGSAEAMEVLVSAAAKITAQPKMNIDDVLMVLEAVKKAHMDKKKGSGKTLTAPALEKFLKANKLGDLLSFVHSVLEYFVTQKEGKTPDTTDKEGKKVPGIRRKVTWDDIDLLETEITKEGFDIIPFNVIKRSLEPSMDEVRRILPTGVFELLLSKKTAPQTSASTARYLGEILASSIRGLQLPLNPLKDKVTFGKATIAALRQGKAPIQYLEEFELSDPNEKILPWSMIRRNVFAYSYDTLASASDLSGLVLEWLESSDLLLPLYHREEGQEEALKSALAIQLKNYTDKTLGSEPWLRAMMDGLVGISESQDLLRALQSEFDLWLFDALSPAVDRWRLPLSPYSFSTEKKDQQLYDSIYGAWLKYLLTFQQKSKESLSSRLKDTFDAFYSSIGEQWNAEVFHDYKPKIPAINKILTSVQDGDVEGLFQLLVEDLEAESGTPCPPSLKDLMLVNPFFLNILRELRLQSVQFPLPLLQGGKKK